MIKKVFDTAFDKVKEHKIIATISIIVIGLILFFLIPKASTQDNNSSFSFYVVQRGSIKNTIKVVGKIKVTDQKVLTFGQAGDVKKIYVNEGDFVVEGQLLAELDKNDLVNDITSQQLSMENAQMNYRKLLGQNTESDILKAKQTLESSKNSLDMGQKELETLVIEKNLALRKQDITLKQTEDSLNILQGNYDNSGSLIKTGSSVIFSSQMKSSITTAQNSIKDSRNMLIYVDSLFGITDANRIKNDSFELFLSAKDTSSKNQTEIKFYEANKLLSEFEIIFSNVNFSNSPSVDDIKNLQNKNLILMNSLISLFDIATKACLASISSSSLSQATIDGRASTLNGYNGSVINYASTLNNLIKQFATEISDISTSESSLETMEIDKKKLIIDYDIKIQKKQDEISGYENQIIINQLALNDMYDGLQYEDKVIQENGIRQQMLNLQKAKSKSSDYEIRAPFSGKIAKIDFDNGDKVGTTEGITIQKPNIYEVEVSIDQIDITKLEKGQQTEINIDAYPNENVVGEVVKIDPIPTESAGVVSYTARISLGNFNKKLYEGMTTTVNIITVQKDSVLVVPSSFVQSSGQDNIVYVKNLSLIPQDKKNNNSGDFNQMRGQMSGDNNFSPRQRSGYMAGSGNMNQSGQYQIYYSGSINSGGMRTQSGRKQRMSQIDQNLQGLIEADTSEPEARIIILGISNGTEYEILSGLNPGDILISKGYTMTSTTTKQSSASPFGGGSEGGNSSMRQMRNLQ